MTGPKLCLQGKMPNSKSTGSDLLWACPSCNCPWQGRSGCLADSAQHHCEFKSLTNCCWMC